MKLGRFLGERSESLRGEAPQALPVEGVLNPINCRIPPVPTGRTYG